MAKDKDIAAAFINQAQSAMTQGNHQDARVFFLRALEVVPDLPDAHYGLATVCFLQGDVLGAAHHFKEVTRHDPLRAGAFINLGALYNHLGREDDAIHALSRGIQLDPNRAEGYYNLGLVYRRIGQPAQAIEAYREAVRLQPDLADAHFNLANILLDEEHFAHAIAHYQAALKIRPNWPEAEQGLEMAQECLDEQVDERKVSHETVVDFLDSAERTIPTEEEEPRQLDPAVHGALLAEIHKVTADADVLSKSLSEDIARELEAVLKELSACLLRPDTPAHELTKNLEAFEAVAERFKKLREQLEQVCKTIQVSSEDLKRK